MAGLSTTALPVLNSASLGGYYDGIISTLGLQGQQSNQMVQNFGNLVTQLTNQQQSVSGVSLDQEATNMIRYQPAYGAAADFINTLNTVLNTLIQQVG
jgi:flagellar hook-associated protein 1 FlgK